MRRGSAGETGEVLLVISCGGLRGRRRRGRVCKRRLTIEPEAASFLLQLALMTGLLGKKLKQAHIGRQPLLSHF
ncbi:hypothetical protein ACHHV8_20430 [Paenibacillus sp. TAB 01]|uniref:hypothetical protein n=1 Tax=Paenibacillus sp. TAB 01 TaxID=3368988 RepID=UPI0037535744